MSFQQHFSVFNRHENVSKESLCVLHVVNFKMLPEKMMIFLILAALSVLIHADGTDGTTPALCKTCKF